ncbi:MAG: SpoIID/LytB domain-containing protein [Ilumatobacteraceae bacterium]
MAKHLLARRQVHRRHGRYLVVFRRLMLVLAIAAPTCVVSPVVAPAAASPAVADTVITLDGHGNGHGYGLSQWGAYGYAVDYGWTTAQILDHYYGGTVAGTVPLESTVAVRLMNLDDAQTAVVSGTGGLLVDGVAGGPWQSVVAREVAPSTYSVWARADAQVCPSATDDPVATGWTLVAASVATQVTVRTQMDSSATANYSDLAATCEPSGTVRSYRGVIRAVNGAAGENRTVNEVPVEQYLRSVIAKEMSPGWASAGGGRGARALEAQAVAARSFALAENRYPYARTCDLICQTYLGAASRSSVAGNFSRVEYPATDAAVLATAGVVRRVGTADGPISLTMFAASSGGWTAAGVGPIMPFTAVADAGDATSLNPNFNWSTTLLGSAVTARYPAIGTFVGVTVLARNGFGDWGGRVTSIQITGSAGSVMKTGDEFRSAFGLKSNWFNVRGSTPIDPCAGRNAPPVNGALATQPPARYRPIAPTRLIDTRTGVGSPAQPVTGGCTLVVDPGLDPSVTAVAVNLTTVSPAAAGYLTAYPCGVERPVTSVVQAITSRAVAGATVVPLGADGTFCIYTYATTDVLVDLFGSYQPSVGEKFEPVSPARVYDSRASGRRIAAGSVVTIPIAGATAPAGATGVALSVQAIDPTGAGFVTVFPCSSAVPIVSSLNVVPAGNIANHVEVALSAAGTVCAFVSTSTHLIVDLSGWYGAGATTEFYAMTPVRALDTRNGIGLSGVFGAGSNRVLPLAGSNGLPPAAALRAVVGEVTSVSASSVGFLTVHPCAAVVPEVSMVQTSSSVNAASVVIGADDAQGRWCIAVSNAMHVLVDVSGYFA